MKRACRLTLFFRAKRVPYVAVRLIGPLLNNRGFRAALFKACALCTVLALTAGCAGDVAQDCFGLKEPSPGGSPTRVELSFEDPWPITDEMLAFHDIPFVTREENGRKVVDLELDNVRDLPMPPPSNNRVHYLDRARGRILQDPRSRIDELWRIDDVTVFAADVAYEVTHEMGPDLRSSGTIDTKVARSLLPAYKVKSLWADTLTGFAGVVFEPLSVSPGQAHRIYALAGTHVFHRTDFRTWATGLMISRSQFAAGAALLMLQDAAEYAQDMEHGGEVFITGQSQGALTAQGFGYLLQAYLNTSARDHHLVHVVSWGGAGAQGAIKKMIETYKTGGKRGYLPGFEQHWQNVEPTYADVMKVWNAITPTWDAIPDDAIDNHIQAVSAQMRIIGYFFEIDIFARAGTFPGTTMVFPTAMVLPDRCERLVSERELGITAGSFGVRLESHFLNAYQRAVSRGAIGLSLPAEPKKWSWAEDLLPMLDRIGSAWLTTTYLDTLGESEINWQRCYASAEWMTDQNRWCERKYWPGCGHDSGSRFETGSGYTGGQWCLIKRGELPSKPFDPPPPGL